MDFFQACFVHLCPEEIKATISTSKWPGTHFKALGNTKMPPNTSQLHHKYIPKLFLTGIIIWNEKEWLFRIVPRRQWSLKCWKSNLLAFYLSSISDIKSSSSLMNSDREARLLLLLSVSLSGSRKATFRSSATNRCPWYVMNSLLGTRGIWKIIQKDPFVVFQH